MTTARDPDDRILAWLAEGPTSLPTSTARAIEVAAQATPQHRRTPVPRWKGPNPMHVPKGLAVAAALVIAVVGGLLLASPGTFGPVAPTSSPSPSPSPSMSSSPPPSPSPTPSAPAASPAVYTSSQYGFTVEHPAAWRPTPATEAWDGGMVGPGSASLDQFYAPPTGVGVTFVGIGAQPLPDGMDATAWMTDYAERLEAAQRDCGAPASAWIDIEVLDGVPGRRVTLPCEPEDGTEVLFVVDGIGYLFTGQPGTVDRMLEGFQPG
jgi:hypothetical protein